MIRLLHRLLHTSDPNQPDDAQHGLWLERAEAGPFQPPRRPGAPYSTARQATPAYPNEGES